MVHTTILALGILGQEDDKLKASVGYIVRPCFKQNQRDIRRKKKRKRWRREEKGYYEN